MEKIKNDGISVPDTSNDVETNTLDEQKEESITETEIKDDNTSTEIEEKEKELLKKEKELKKLEINMMFQKDVQGLIDNKTIPDDDKIINGLKKLIDFSSKNSYKKTLNYATDFIKSLRSYLKPSKGYDGPIEGNSILKDDVISRGFKPPKVY